MTMPLSHELDRAEAFDRAGNHVEALNCLVAAVRNNDVEGLTRLAKRLLIGDRAPFKPRDAVGMLTEAAAKGSAEAPALLSVLFALGLQVNQDWKLALDALVRSAQYGWRDSQHQLRVLAGDRQLAARTADEHLWRQLADSIDLRFWHTPPAERVLQESPLVCSYPGFVPVEVCDWLRERATSRLRPAEVYDAVAREVTVHRTRTNSAATFNLLETDLINVLVQARMAASVSMPLRNFEAATVLHYSVGQQIADHFDFIDPNIPDYEQQLSQAGQRFITFLVYLNDDYLGGETAFPRLGLTHKGQQGEGLFFVNAFRDGRADPRTLHAGRPIEQGEKWIVSQFIRSRQFF